MVDTNMTVINVLLDETAKTLKFVLRADAPPPPPPNVDLDHWFPTPLEIVTQPVNIQRGSAKVPTGMTITYIEVEGRVIEQYWKYTWNQASGSWGVPVETDRQGNPI